MINSVKKWLEKGVLKVLELQDTGHRCRQNANLPSELFPVLLATKKTIRSFRDLQVDWGPIDEDGSRNPPFLERRKIRFGRSDSDHRNVVLCVRSVFCSVFLVFFLFWWIVIENQNFQKKTQIIRVYDHFRKSSVLLAYFFTKYSILQRPGQVLQVRGFQWFSISKVKAKSKQTIK